ncbi:hypothetical protein AGIG_G11059 [Arapaima gigas]
MQHPYVKFHVFGYHYYSRRRAPTWECKAASSTCGNIEMFRWTSDKVTFRNGSHSNHDTSCCPRNDCVILESHHQWTLNGGPSSQQQHGDAGGAGDMKGCHLKDKG